MESPGNILIGGNGVLAQAFAEACETRGMDYSLSVPSIQAMEKRGLYAVVDAGAPPERFGSEDYSVKCHREHVLRPMRILSDCAKRRILYLGFSSAHVFDGSKGLLQVESDTVAPLSAYGRAQALAETHLRAAHSACLIIRTGEIFGSGDENDFVSRVTREWSRGHVVEAADDLFVSSVYLPSVVECTLDLLAGHATGLWHVTHGRALSEYQFAMLACAAAGFPSRFVRRISSTTASARRTSPALGSERSNLLGSVEESLRVFAQRMEREPVFA